MNNLRDKRLDKSEKEKLSKLKVEKVYPEKIPESQGDLADRADIEIEQEMQELIWQVLKRIYRSKT